MSLQIGILVFPNVQQLDLTGPYETFASLPGAQVHLLWKDLVPLRSATGLMLAPTMLLADCPALDVLCVPGGSGVNALMEDARILAFIREQAARARYVTSVCTGSLVLGAAGLLRGKHATSHWNAHDFLGRFGAIPTQGRVVQDGNLITAGGVTSGIDFGLTVIAELLGAEQAQAVQLMLEYAPAPPFASGTPEEAPASVLEVAGIRLAGSRAARQAILDRIAPA